MRSALRTLWTQRPGAACRSLTVAVFAAGLVVTLGCAPAAAASRPTPSPSPTPSPTPTPSPSPAPSPTPTPKAVNADVSSGRATLDLGSSFLERLAGQATGGANRILRTSPGGGGASEALDGPRFRAWGEAYGITARTGSQGGFVGDTRTTWGGVAGIGAQLMQSVNVGLSVDQSRTQVDVPAALQSATLDLTQIGLNASVDEGPWTWAVALVHGVGDINSRRDTGLGTAAAGYGAHITGALSELDYFWTSDQSRIVPKLAFEYVRASTGALQETGGLDPSSASAASLERARVLLGAEVGHDIIFDGKILDLSAYGKFVDNVSQNVGSVTVSLGAQSITVQGIGESRYGADAGAAASLSLSSTARLYLNYDGKFRSALQSHQGTFGVEFKW
jgi:uncharacterized protein with beta-barrel porin domain